MNKTSLERKSVYHVPGTKCLLWFGIDSHSWRRQAFIHSVRMSVPMDR
jgi:hypothetical protein